MKSIYTTTWNNAPSLSTPDSSGVVNGRLSILFKAVRGCSQIQVNDYMTKASNEDLIDTFILAFQTRDPRGGKGERDLGRLMFKWLFENYPSEFEKILQYIPEYSRWDDLLTLFPNVVSTANNELQVKIVKLFSEQLKKDKELMLQGTPISLCAKWCPTEGDSDDKKYKLVETLCNYLSITPRQYRKDYITPLRAYLNIVETKMCQNRWEEIEFDKVPSCAIKILKKAFEKHTPEKFVLWKQSLESGKTKVNAKVLHPHELVREMRISGKADEVVQSQWKILEDEVRKLGTLQDTVVVVDTSGSMQEPKCLPLDISVAMGLIISSVVEGEFKGNVITFNTNPEFVEICDGDIFSKFQQVRNIPWGGSTNLAGTFDMILHKGKAAGLKDEDMPKRLVIVSDMQFDQIEGYGSYGKTNFQVIEDKYKAAGYTRPNIVFWNVACSPTSDFPVSVDDNGTCLVSGASPAILKGVLRSKEFNSVAIMREILDDERYSQIRTALS